VRNYHFFLYLKNFLSVSITSLSFFKRFDLGTLYESCNQLSDSIDAYQRASDLDPQNATIKQRLAVIKHAHATGT